MPTEHLPIFVYGTLKRGEVREKCWPRPAVQIERATTHARLYDLGPYPAIADGDDLISGELWHVAREDLEVTLEVLDEIECFGNDDVDLYVRRIVECRTLAGEKRRAYAYYFASTSQLQNRPHVPPDANGLVCWHANK